jgi:membrane-bound serine protease (ClpP class)
MRRILPILLAALLLPAAARAAGGAASAPGPAAAPAVLVATIDGSINPVSADYLASAVAEAETRGAGMLVLELDTPGGLESAMRRMVRDILNTRVPVVVFVSPSGARAASAGLLVTLASDVAAMAPGTSIGAAHPVGIGGGTMDNTMAGKVENDSAAYARSLAEKKGRNPAWAETAVRKSASLTEREALDNGVIDLVSPDLPSLLARLEGRTVRKDAGSATLRTKGAPVVRFPMRFRHRVLSALADPNVAYILLMIGIYGIFFELANPGALFPGIVGGIALILGFFALQTLSADYAGVLLILLGVVLFLLEIKIVSHGALAMGGTVAMFLGGLMLFRSAGDPWLRVSWSVLGTMAALSALFFSSLVWLVVRSRGAKPTTGVEGLVGANGEARSDFGPDGKGKIYVQGELWDARAVEPLSRGDDVTVESVDGMTLHVRPRIRAGNPEPQHRS